MYADLNLPAVYTHNEPLRKEKKNKANKTSAANTPSTPTAPTAPTIDTTQLKSLESRTRTLIHLGYSVAGYDHYVKNFTHSNHTNPFTNSQPLFPGLDTRSSHNPRTLIQLSRLTVELDEAGDTTKQLGQGAVSVLNAYDLLAVKPTGPITFNHACLNMCTPSPFAVHIIQLDLAAHSRLPFFLKRSTLGKAIADGAFFEVCYGGALDGGDDYARRNLIANVKELLRVTSGKGIIFSSCVSNALHLRSPGDIINLATVFGMNQSVAKKALTDNPKTVINNSNSRRLFKGILSDPIIHHPSNSAKRASDSTDIIDNSNNTPNTSKNPPKKKKQV
ncbi:hypothetical protein E3P84_02429 [Wallemia ichthyophaga]|nr:hypothetical protein E3P84_02429 [Wallemia ichthyophaga]TIB41087.1 hypothetical protein E3P83_02382 [Wallemia ichthyophaga]